MRISRRNGPRRNPQNGVEGIHWVETAVKTKHEFIEVGLQMTRFDAAVMSAFYPRLQIGEDKVDHRQVLFRLFWVTPEGKRIVSVTHLAKPVISLPAVSADDEACRYVVLDECDECFGGATRKRGIRPFDAGDNTEPEATSISEFLGRNAALVGIFPFRAAILGILARPNLNGTHYRRLMMNSPPFTPRAPANATFVYFDGMRRPDGITAWAHHTGAEFMKHSKRRLVSGDPKLALKLDGGLTGRLRRHEVSAPKPRREGHMARLHDRASRERCIFFAGATAQYDRRAGCKPIWFPDEPALRAREAIRPADRLQITGASGVIREYTLKLWKARWESCIHA